MIQAVICNNHFVNYVVRRAMLFIALCFAAPEYLYTQNHTVQFSFKLDQSAKTSAGVYTKDSILLRTLWSGVNYQAGIHQAEWDGKDDEGRLLKDTAYVIRVLSNNVSYTWEGVLGNTSDSMTGPSVIRMFRRFEGMAILDSTAYFASGYGEGTSSAHKLNLHHPQQKTSILQSYSTDQNSDFVATDGSYVYWAGYDPYKPSLSWTYATKVGNDSEVLLDSGKSLSAFWGRTYTHSIDIIQNDSIAYPTGLAVQQKGRFLFIAHGRRNTLHVLDKRTGALLHRLTYRDVRGIVIGKDDHLWMITAKDSVAEYVADSNGLLSAPVVVLKGIVKPLALGISPAASLIAVVDGDTCQQVKAYDYQGKLSWVFGKKGGYDSGPEVTNDKFYFDDRDKPFLVTGYDRTFIAFEPDGSFWIGDNGNERVQHYDSLRRFIERIMQLPHSYNIAMDANDPTRVFNEFLEFRVDYSKPLKPNNGSWELVRNWRYGIPKNYFRDANALITVFYEVTTLSNGRTYAMIGYIDSISKVMRPEVVELQDSGHVRFTGMRMNPSNRFLMTKQGTIRQLVSRLEIGQAGRWEEIALKGFDSSNNPVWDTAVIIAALPKIKASDPAFAETARPERTASGMLLVFNPGKLNRGFHLGAIRQGEGSYQWKTAMSTTPEYMGPYPGDGSFDIGNGVKYPGGDVYSVDRNIFWNYHGEFWKNSQTNIWHHVYDNGLTVSQFGVTSIDGELLQPDAFPMGAGNVFSSVVVKIDSNYYLYHNDESVHAGVHRWKISGLNTIKEQSIPVKTGLRSGGLGAAYFNGPDLDNYKRRITRIDSVVQLFSAPAGIDSSHFSARWTGFVEAPSSQDYTFFIQTNKGVRLWVDGQLVINTWYNKRMRLDSSARLTLEAGKLYAIRMEANGDTALLNWHDTTGVMQLLPSSSLYPAELPVYDNGVDLMEGLTYKDTVETGLYGWERNPSYEKENAAKTYWYVRNNVRSTDKEHPDLFMYSKNDSIPYEVRRSISLSNTCVSSWELTGRISFEDNMPNNNPGMGSFFDVLDDSGRIISRITHSMLYKKDHFQARIVCNDSFITDQHINVLSLVTNKPQDFSILSDSTGLIFSYSDFQPIHVAYKDSLCHWKKPSALRFLFVNGTTNLNRSMDVEKLRLKVGSELSSRVGLSGKTSICQGDSIILTADSASAYLWNTKDTTRRIVVRNSGTYAVKVSDRSACSVHSESTAVMVHPLPEPAINIFKSAKICAGDSVVLTTDSAKSYVWNTLQKTRSITVRNTGNYSVKVTDSNGCSASSVAKSIVVNSLPAPVITAGSSTTFCQGDSVVLTAGASSSYLWNNNATTRSIKVFASGIYKVTVTDSNGCSNISSPVTVTVNALPSVSVSTFGPLKFCDGDSVILTSSASASYLWNNNETNRTIRVKKSGNYSVKATDANGCFAFSSPVRVTANALPVPSISANSATTFCSGDSVRLTSSSSLSYLWNNASTSRSITVRNTGSYRVKVTDTNSCSAYTSFTNVKVNPLPVPVVSAGSATTFCSGDSVMLTVNQGAAYLWNTNAGSRTIVVKASGNYSVKLTDSNACWAISAPVTVKVNPLPKAVITAGSSTTFCDGDSVILTASLGSSYQWNNSASTRSVKIFKTGTYAVRATDTNNCSAISLSVTVKVNPLPAVSVTAGSNTTFCQGDSVVLTVSNAKTYLWNTNDTSRSVRVSKSGNYSVKVTDTNGCSALSSNVAIKVNPLPQPVITANSATKFCSGDSVILSTGTSKAYLWSNGSVNKSIRVYNAGNYAVTVTDSNGCSLSSATTPVVVYALPAANITAGGPTVFCQGDSVRLTANPSVNYIWNNNATTRSILVTAQGTYAVRVRDSNACWSAAPATITVKVNSLPNPKISASKATSFCQGDSVLLTCSKAKSYKWNTNDSTASIAVFNAGNYSVRVTDSNGCSATSAVTVVKVYDLPTPVISAKGPVTFCTGDSVELVSAQAVSYLWNNNISTQKSIKVFASGTYRVKVTDTNACSATSQPVSVLVNALPQARISANAPTTFCKGDSVVLTANPSVAYAWNTSGSGGSIKVYTTGTYRVKVTDSNGCSAWSSNISVKVNDLPVPVIKAGSATTFCDGDSVMLTCSPAGSYRWNTQDNTQSIVVSKAGNYQVTLTDSNACSAISSAMPVKVNALPDPIITASSSTSFCDGDSVVLTASSSGAYLWNTNASTRQVTIHKAGNYTVKVTDSNACSAISGNINITVHQLPVASISTNTTTTFCNGDSVVLTASPATSYLWNNNETRRNIIVHQSGAYTVKVTDSNACSAVSASAKVTVHALQTPIIIAGPSTIFCDGDSVKLSASRGASYRWSNNDTQRAVTVYKSGNFYVTVADSNGCSSTSDTITIKVNVLPFAQITANSDTTLCQGDSVRLTSSGGKTYLWNNTFTTNSISVDQSGRYSVKVTDSNTCSATASLSVIVHPLPEPVVIAGSQTEFCDGDSVVLSTNLFSSYDWNIKDTGRFITVKQSGLYNVNVVDSNGCSATSNDVIIKVNPLPVAVLSANSATTFCAGDSVVLVAGQSKNYIWNNNETTQRITVLNSGIFSVKVTDSNGCSNVSGPIAVKVNPLPKAAITAASSTVLCDGDSVQLSSNAAVSYLWNTKDTNRYIYAKKGGIYTVRIIDSNSCSSVMDSVHIIVNALPQPFISAGSSTTFCDGDSVVLSASQAVSYLWNNNDTTAGIIVKKGGLYTVSVTDSNGCSAKSSSFIVKVNTLPTPVITAGSALEFCEGDSVALTASPAVSYVWTNNSKSQIVHVLNTGSYTVHVTDSNGCEASSAEVFVKVNPLPEPAISTSSSTNFCDGDSVKLTASAAISYQWNTNDTSRSIVVSDAGNYTVLVTDSNTCSAKSDAISVVVHALPDQVITASDVTSFCEGDSVVLSVNNARSYQWNTNDTNAFIKVFKSGNYSVKVTDSNGCSAVSSILPVNVYALPQPLISSTSLSICKGDSVKLTAGTWVKYTWNTQDTLDHIIVYNTGNFTVTVLDSNGCSATSIPANVKVNNLPSATITPGGPASFCDGDSVVLTASPALYYQWNTGDTTRSVIARRSGVYAVKITDTNRCSSVSASISVTVNSLPVATVRAGGPVTFCDGDSVVLVAGGGKSYLWNSQSVSDRLTVFKTGNYLVNVTDTNGCAVASDSMFISVNPLPDVVISTLGKTTFCAGDSLKLKASAASSYLWNDNAQARERLILKTGNYTVRVTDSNGCIGYSDTIQVRVNDLPVKPQITYQGTLEFCKGDSVILSAAGKAVTYKWNTSDTGSSIKVFTSGTYRVRITDKNSCSVLSDSIHVKVNSLPDPSISVSSKLEFCKGDSLMLSANTGLSYQWNTNDTTRQLKVFSSGTYVLKVTDSNACSANSDSLRVKVHALPSAVITAGSSTVFCNGDSVELKANPGYAYQWNTNDTLTRIKVRKQGYYTVRVTDTNGCSASASPVFVRVNPLPAIPVITAGNSGTFCRGDSVVLTSSPAYSYKWSTAQSSRFVVVKQTGKYSVNITDTNGCSAVSKPFDVFVNPLPVAKFKADRPTTFCQGDSVVLTSDSASGYVWNTKAATRRIAVHTSGTYFVTVTDSNGCSARSRDTMVVVNALPAIPKITANSSTTFCKGDSVHLSSSAAVHYNWNTSDTSRSVTVKTSGSFTVIVTDINGCSSLSSAISVKVNTAIVPVISSNANTSFCYGDSVILTSSTANTYLWNNNTYKKSVTVFKSGRYTVMTADSNGCNAVSQPVDVTVHSLPQPFITAIGSTSICDGDSVILSSSPASAYLWSSGRALQNIAIKTSGIYSVKVIDSNGCSASSQPVSIKVNALPVPVVKPGKSTEICQGDSVVLTASPLGKYVWNTSSVKQTITVLSAGSYRVSVTDSNGCQAWSAPVDIVVNSLPVAVISQKGPATFCMGDSVVLESDKAFRYDWNTGEISQQITVMKTGAYRVKVTDTNGCSALSNTVNATANPLPEPLISAQSPTSFCAGDSVVLKVATYKTYLWDDGDTSNKVTVYNNDILKVKVTDSNGCSNISRPVIVTVHALPLAAITADKPTSFCGGDTVTLTASPGKQYLWNNAAKTAAIKVFKSGDYFVAVTDSNGCSSVSSLLGINTKALPVPSITSNGSVSFCMGDSVMLTASKADKYLWSNHATTQSIIVSKSATYAVTVSDANGCYASSDTAVIVHELPVPLVTADRPITFCDGDSVVLTVAEAKQYLWNGMQTSRSITIFKTGNYQVTITDSNGCSASSVNVLISVNSLPQPVVTPGGSLDICSGDSLSIEVNASGTYLWNNNRTSRRIYVSKPGVYFVTVTDGNTCSATSGPVEIRVHEVPEPVIMRNGNILSSSATQGNQWYRDGQKIDGASLPSYLLVKNGAYTVSVTDSGCTRMSDTVLVQDLSVQSVDAGIYIEIVPNPSEGKFVLKTNMQYDAKVQVFNAIGEIVYTSNQTAEVIDLSGFAKGIYSVRVQSGGMTWSRKLVLQ